MSHTPGPWNVKIDAHDRGQIYSHSGAWVGTAWRHLDEDDTSLPSVDNARLIAAAPELLQALTDVRDAYHRMFDVMPVAWQTYDHIVNAAIAKATGQ